MGNRHTDEVVDDYLKKYRLPDVERRFFSRLVVGVTEERIYLDYVIDSLSKHEVTRQVRCVLRLALYQLKRTDVPEYAVVDEAIKLARRIGEDKATGLINALLRNFLRMGCEVPLPKPSDQRLSVQYSYPIWLVRYWIAYLGEERTERLLAAGNEKPPLVLRISLTRGTREDLLQRFQNAGIEAAPMKESETGVLILNTGGKNISEFPGYDEGMFLVQDESSQLAVGYRLPKKGDVCVDVCCSPGGKTTHLAEYAETVYAFDISKRRLGITMRNLIRMKVKDKVKLGLVDAVTGVKELNDSADYVLVDAPCSALGTIRRNPDIKYNRIESDILKNAKMQRMMLKRASQYVRAGGVLLYSTCTVTREENEDQIRRFLKKNEDFYLVYERLLLPSEEGTDGFYFAVMEKR